jgi:hypothetical protein
MGWTGPADWAKHRLRKRWADIGPTYIFFLFLMGPGQTRPSHLGWARTARPKEDVNYFADREQQFMFCLQLHNCRRWERKMGGDLAEGMKLLLLA